MDAKKLAIFVLILIAALFAGAVWLGARRDETGKGYKTPAWAESLQNTFGGQEKVLSTGEISSSCFKAGTFLVVSGRTCTAEIAPSSSRVRSMSLALAGLTAARPGRQRPVSVDASRKAQVTIASKGANSVPVQVPLDSRHDTSPTIKILGEGATLTFECKPPSVMFCEVELR